MNQFISKSKAIQLKNSELKIDLAMDATNVPNSPNSGILGIFAGVWAPNIIEQILPVLSADLIATPVQRGGFPATNIFFIKADQRGYVAPYTDGSIEGAANPNANFETRDIYQFQTFITYGELEIERMGLVNLDWVARKRNTAAYIIARARNDIFFNGVAGKRTYGLLNDPSLADIITFPASAAVPSSSKWINKIPNEIIRDIQLLWADIVNRAGGNVNLGMELDWVLVVTPQDQIYLTTPTQYDALNTPLYWIRQVFPNLTIVTAPQYQVGDGSAGNKVQLLLRSWMGQPTVGNLYSYLFRAHQMVPHVSGTSWNQKMSAGSAGAAVTYPQFISTGQGV